MEKQCANCKNNVPTYIDCVGCGAERANWVCTSITPQTIEDRKDMVNHPSRCPVEVIEAIEKLLSFLKKEVAR